MNFTINKNNNIGNIGVIHIILTNFCNQGCPGCYQENLNDTKNNLVLNDNIKNEITKKFNLFKSLNQDVKISFFGGEPLTRTQTIINIFEWLVYSNMIPEYITIPTSGGKNQRLIQDNPLFNKLLSILSSTSFNNTRINISQSYDGPNNLQLRNETFSSIKQSLNIINKNRDFRPEYTSTLIPLNNLFKDVNYFIDTHKDVYDLTGRVPNFRIPYIINNLELSTLQTFQKSIGKYFDWLLGDDFITKNSTSYKRLKLVNMVRGQQAKATPTPNQIPKLFMDFLTQILNPKEQNYMWCGAGLNHFAINHNGAIKESCEYLKEDAMTLHYKMEDICFNCEIQAWCHRPCLKNMESENLEKFDTQCQIRKIIFGVIKDILLEQTK